MTAWKDLERRICNALGGRRAGPLGASISDCVNTPFAVEVKRSSRPGPPVLSQWIIQARTNAKREGRPWLVVVAGHNDRRPTITMDFWTFVEIAQKAGAIPNPLLIAEDACSLPTNTSSAADGLRAPRHHQQQEPPPHTERGQPMHETDTTTEPDVPQPPDEPEPDTGDEDDED